MKSKSRREFLRTSAISAASLAAASSLPSWARSAAKPATTAITPPLSVFGYPNVQLLESHFLTQFQQNHELFLSLNEDALLKPFRQREGLPSPGPDMGG